ncbi:MAG: FAD:protein FMN transferase [Bacteroidales bacterium]|jgi:thiamine biosynthesis lipoprotein|nr:FAD:protein FMN transferase [Bacteroidales bacterium]
MNKFRIRLFSKHYFHCSIIACLLFLSTGCSFVEKQIHLEGFTQGTYYSIRYYDPQNRNLQEAIDSLLNDFDNTASVYNDSSVISRINRNEDNVCLTDDFIRLYLLSEQIGKQTHGAFDITVGSLVNAWGFGREQRQTMSKEKIDSLLTCVGFGKTSLDQGKIIKELPCIQLNFNAIAQGYTVDKIASFFDTLSIADYLVDIGGEVIAKGNKNGQPWMVGIEHPSKEKEQERQIILRVPLENKSLVTSGNYRKYYEENGVRYGHTLSPQTGYPVEHALLSVTVLHPSAAFADAYATAFMVMGMEASLDFIAEHQDVEAFFIYQKQDSIHTRSTDGFVRLLNQQACF